MSLFPAERPSRTASSFYAYSPYGQSVTLGPDGGNSIQYTGRENDGTGLLYYRARYYDPVLKQWTSEDPIGIDGGINLRSYVDGNPINYADPLGLMGFGGGGSAGSSRQASAPSSCGCSSSFGSRWLDAFSTTMSAVPGIAAPVGLGFFGAKSFARAVGGQTWGQWWNAPNWYVYGMPKPPISLPVATSIARAGAYGLAFTGGVAIGSAIYAGLTCD